MASSTEPTYDPETYWVAPKRNFRSSARLHFQHALFQKTLNNVLLHPSIDAAASGSSSLRVADLGCGNGVWLSDLHDSLTAQGVTSHRLDGFDVNPVNFPPAHTLPSNIHLSTLNVFNLPAELEGVYDVVHLRAFVSIVTKNDPSAIIGVVLRMLKPGGHVQWEETRVDLQTCSSAGPEVSKTANETLIKVINAGGAALGNTYDFLAQLGSHLEKGGFESVESKQTPKRPADLKAWTENYLMVWEEIPDLLPSKALAPNSPVTKESFTELFVKCVEETEKGVVVHQEGVLSVVARKPL
ncbi:uncharacterized protein B0I36DRAFT_250086 [Microdochium trichocladiopsis]|uniref:Methyltransferase domain-containing protein n=1 Tax=Microdochium trichocladiopsis TaxID=1682393 RepID=A0A9P8XYH5_9PEZI|nr:uncharacterized protein B0I36DRAFT_250086 [Microdochium trichocladiopsis]KAH7025112.1 hypothetical protein B0I36DRAFT_250086 [Microdochium trichocladiopsis]